MRKKLLLLLIFFLIATAYSQDTFRVNVLKAEVKACESCEEIQDSFASIQATKNEKQRIAALGGYPLGVKDEEYVTTTSTYCIKLSEVDSIDWINEMFVLLTSKVRLLVIWNGPDGIGTFLSDWFDLNKNTCQIFSVSTDKTGFSKGLYQVSVFIDNENPGSASGTEVSYSMRLH